MAKRPVFIPTSQSFPFVKAIGIEFDWYPGFSKSQAQKSIASLHKAAAKQGISPVLEISSKSPKPLGVGLSAFNLRLEVTGNLAMTVECAFQGSKVFERGGPFTDLYYVSSKEAKKDARLHSSGELVAFRFLGEKFPIKPATAFYDWLYITALWQNKSLWQLLSSYKGFSDIAFNPKRSLNCQARSAALSISLQQAGLIEHAVVGKDQFMSLITEG